jgi:hypothetical protein
MSLATQCRRSTIQGAECFANYSKNYIENCIVTRNTWPACAPANIGNSALGCA